MIGVDIIVGDCRESLKSIPDEGAQCCVTSPPYFGLRDYGHAGQIGLEPTPEAFVSQMVAVFREVRRALKPDGTLWLNLGDTYCSTAPGTMGDKLNQRGILAGVSDRRAEGSRKTRPETPEGLKPKDLIGIPWRVAFALQADGWYLRSDIIWHKPNPMPESVTDRPTKSHEYLFLMSKSDRYFYDHESIKEPSVDPKSTEERYRYEFHAHAKESNGAGRPNGATNTPGMKNLAYKGQSNHSFHQRRADGLPDEASPVRNKRSVWTVPTAPYNEAHFATYPPDLIKPCILAGSRPGDIVLDPFGGSGTTGMVAMELGRSAILCELNPEYAELARARCSVTPGFPNLV